MQVISHDSAVVAWITKYTLCVLPVDTDLQPIGAAPVAGVGTAAKKQEKKKKKKKADSGALRVFEHKKKFTSVACHPQDYTIATGHENGVVRTPAGFRDAFAAWYEGGWNALSVPQQWGGQGLPGVLSQCLTEMAMSANLSLSTYVGLTGGVSGTLMRIAPEDLKQIYVPKLLSGAWTGTMNLTEPHCGTDLKLMRTTAVEQDDGTYLINGTKIFITGGEHDMADNIVHLVLAKVPGEGDGLSAVSLFLVPKFAVSADGSLGPRNGVTCGGIEDKMGLKGSATAVLHYEDAVGVRLGPKPKPRSEGDGGKPRRSSGGMAGMFQLMNGARIGVGMQGIAMAEVAYQNAVRYANERLSGRALQGAQAPDQPADPAGWHNPLVVILQ